MTLLKHISDELREKFQYWDLSSEESLSELADFIAQTLETEVQRAVETNNKKINDYLDEYPTNEIYDEETGRAIKTRPVTFTNDLRAFLESLSPKKEVTE